MNASTVLTLTARRRRDIVLKRTFDAPRRLVFNALTLPEMLGHWFGPAEASLVVCEVDLRRGGNFRYVWRTADGRETRMSGRFLEIAAPGRIVAIERFEVGGWRAAFTSITELTEADGLTTLTRTVRPVEQLMAGGKRPAPVEREAALGYDRLDELFDPETAGSR